MVESDGPRLSPRGWLVDLVSRLAAAAYMVIFGLRIWDALQVRPELRLVMFLITECLVLVLVLFARKAQRVDRSPLTLLLVGAVLFYALTVDLLGGASLVPPWVGVSVQALGILMQLSAKWTLGRSFGLLPADRGIVTRGFYRLVRHPIYLGYFVTHIGFLLGALSWHNIAVYYVLWVFQFLRLRAEERVLRQNPEYLAYCERVPYRIIPGLF